MVIMFLDLAGFTALTEAHGDQHAVDAIDEFEALVSRIARRHGLRVIKSIGDAVLVVGDAPASAVEAAKEVVREMARREGSPDVRIGINCGVPIERDGDVLGGAVNVSARITAEAKAGEILVSQSVVDGLDATSELRSVGKRALKHLKAPVPLYEVVVDADRRFVDPVCRMTFSQGSEVATLVHEGEKICFCSQECLRLFLDRPEDYT